MRTEMKQLRSEICRLKRNGSFISRLNNAQKVSESVAFQQALNKMSKPSQLFLNMQLQNVKKPKGRRFTTPEKILCLSIYKKSPKCYEFLQRTFTLPSAKAMKRLLSKIKLCPGINPVIFEKIKKTVAEKCKADKLCSLSFDEMSISPQINYNNQKDIFEGFALNDDHQFADHALVFMVKGVKQNFKQPIAYYFTSCLKKTELKNIIKTVIRHAQDSGLIIINTVCDQSTVNVSAINELIDETKASYLRKGVEWRYDCFSIKGRKIIPLFDTPHLIKGIRNNLLTKDLVYTTKNKEKLVKWEYYQKVYGADKSYGDLKLLHKITEEHIDPEKINKMRVKTATQIFSHSVAVVTDHLTARGDLPEECLQLVDITLLLDNLFDSLNVSTLNIPDGKIFKGAVKYNSPHHELWKESKKVLKTVKFIQKRVSGNKIRLITATVPSITNLIRTIEGVEAIWQVLFKKFGLDAMLTRNFNQDPVENFFGNIRSYGARNNAPNTICFEGAFKALLLNNYSSPHSRRANCEEDGNECLQNLDFFLRENCNTSIPEETSDIPEEIHFNEDLCVEMQPQEDAGQGNYVCGWVLTKCLKKICKSCQQCRKTLINTANQNNKYIKAKEYCNKTWLCYPSELAEKCFHSIQNITKSFLKKNIPKKDIKKSIIVLCDILVEYPFDCLIHKEKLKACFLDLTINIILYSWCRNINRILSGKITYEGEEELKKNAAIYYNKRKHYKNKK